MNIWITSDTHFCHDKEFIWRPRGFNSVKEQDETIVENWNSVVKSEDTVYMLGDAVLVNNELGMEYMRKLNGNIYLVIGNHDTDTRIKLYKSLPNIKDVQFGYRISSGKKTFILSHYPSIVANGNDTTPIFGLCGHSHTKDKWLHWDIAKTYHVELDAHNNFPVSIEQIKKDIVNKRNGVI